VSLSESVKIGCWATRNPRVTVPPFRSNYEAAIGMGTEVDTLPLSVIAAIAKGAVPEQFNVSKDAKVALQRAAGVFILYLNSAANDVCKSSKRSTVSGPDILRALEEIDMGELVKPCKQALEGE
jgi:DNA polymerase epsilon subunit 3